MTRPNKSIWWGIALALSVPLAANCSSCSFGCNDGSSCVQEAVCCAADQREASNVDCAFCCTLNGGPCEYPDRGVTFGHPCCNFACQPSGMCGCSHAGAQCQSNSECCYGNCANGLCQPLGCDAGGSCPAGLECQEGTCLVGVKGPCVFNEDCTTNLCVDGGCATPCSVGCGPENPACSSQSDCPRSTVCTVYLATTGYALAADAGLFLVLDAGTACCEPSNTPCDSKIVCCSLYCDATGTCRDSCGTGGSFCDNAGACCAGESCAQAYFNYSSDLACCVDNGQPCVPNGYGCCSGYPSVCAAGDSCGCVPSGTRCSALVADGGCCSGICSETLECL